MSRPQFFTIPAGQKPAQCTGPTCRAVIYWIRHPRTGRMHPVDCDVDGGFPPSDTNDRAQLDLLNGIAEVHDGLGVSHFDTCPDADHFRGSR